MPDLREQGPIPSQRLRWWTVLLVVWSLSGIYAGRYLMRGWVPHDEGAFAQSADRVLHGELPHRDYTEIYSGGLAYLNAFAFRFLGESFATARIVLFVFFLAWIPVVYWIAAHLAAEWVAGGVTLLAVVWSLPNYPAAVPSWYNLFFATFGSAALLAYLRHHGRQWLFMAGLCAGFSFLAKVVALYYVAAVCLFFVFLEQSETPPAASQSRSRLYTTFVAVSLLLLVIGLTLLQQGGPFQSMVAFVLPVAASVSPLLVKETRALGRPDRYRFLALLRMMAPFSLGIAVPLLLFLVPYVRAQAVGALLRGLFVLPFKRVAGAYMAPPEVATFVPVLFVAVVLVLGARLRGTARWLLTLTVAGLSAYDLVSSESNSISYRTTWLAAYWMIPVVTVLGGGLAVRRAEQGNEGASDLERQQLFLFLSLTAFCSLVQFPFAAPPYFCYVAPLAILTAVAVVRRFPSIPRPLLAVLFAHFMLFAIFRVTPPFIYHMGLFYEPYPETQMLDLPRAGGLHVDRESANVYRELILLIQEHAGTGEIYATPDCPEVYFLAGYKNPTRTLFDFFDDRNGRTERIVNMIDSLAIRVVVLDLHPSFSDVVADDLRSAVAQRFPEKRVVGKFEVRWRS